MQIVQFLQNLAKTHSDFIGYATIGKTFEGRELAMLKVAFTYKIIWFLRWDIHRKKALRNQFFWLMPAFMPVNGLPLLWLCISSMPYKIVIFEFK